MDIEKIIEDYVLTQFDIGDDPDFDRDIHLFDSGFVDSLGATQIVLFIEQEFSIEISQKDITMYPMNTINEIAEVVKSKM